MDGGYEVPPGRPLSRREIADGGGRAQRSQYLLLWRGLGRHLEERERREYLDALVRQTIRILDRKYRRGGLRPERCVRGNRRGLHPRKYSLRGRGLQIHRRR